MKACFISLFAYPLFNKNSHAVIGGAEVQLFNLAKELSKNNDFGVDFVVGDFGQKKEEFFDKIRLIKSAKIDGKRGIAKKIKSVFLQFHVLLKSNSDVYIQRAAGIETGLVAFFCKLFKKKFIYMTASSIDVDGKFRKKNPFAGFIYEYGLKNASTVITQGKEYQELLKRKYAVNSLIIKNSFTLPEKDVIDLSEKKIILWVGSAQSLKQPEVFLKMAEAIPEEKFVMIMPRHNLELWTDIQKKAGKMTNLKFIESVPFEEIGEYFAKSKLFVNTSAFEGFPNTFVQAAMYGTPILSLNVNPDNFLNEYICGFCSEGSLERMICKIREIVKNKSDWQMLSDNAFRYAIKNHDISVNAEKLKEIMECQLA
jgi:glycosyltransferase involved in cell wall biosynthesis